MDKEYAKKILEETKENYNIISQDFSRTRNKFWEEMGFISKYVNDNEKVLDLGCGNGRLYELFQEKTIDYYGVDFSEKLIEIAKKRYPQFKFQVADALNLPFPADYFDKVFSIAVLHHIPSKELRLKFLQEIKRVLKPEGILILSVWHFNAFKKIKFFFKFLFLKIFHGKKIDSGDAFIPWGKKLLRYVHNFSTKELTKLVKKACFKVIDVRIISRPKAKESNILIVAEDFL
ncbi:MAG: class I SAM-dependent methyltransferase [Candidatus Nealsonbacteria bacterium]